MKKFTFFLVAILFVFTNELEARYYDSKTGRFLSEDPIGFEGGDVNLYAYTGNNPVNYTDPYGLFIQGAIPYICVINPPVCIGMGIGIGIGIGIMYYNPPKVPPIPFALPKPPEQCKDDNGDKCEKQAQADETICRSLSDPGVRARCWASANERYGACRAGRPLPPLITR